MRIRTPRVRGAGLKTSLIPTLRLLKKAMQKPPQKNACQATYHPPFN